MRPSLGAALGAGNGKSNYQGKESYGGGVKAKATGPTLIFLVRNKIWRKVVSASDCMGDRGIFLWQGLRGQLVSAPPWRETENYVGKGGGEKTQEPYGILYFFLSYHLV